MSEVLKKRGIWQEKSFCIGFAGAAVLLLPALAAPFLANGRPLIWSDETGSVVFPFLRSFFAPDSSEVLVEKFFNYMFCMLLSYGVLRLMFLRNIKLRKIFIVVAALLWLLPFVFVESRMDKTDYRAAVKASGKYALFAPVPYGPFELSGEVAQTPGKDHWFGCDDIGRDVFARLIYGARVSLAVGFFATVLTLITGVTVGLVTGFFKGWFDLVTMRLVEILLCFPTFLLLLILMSLLRDCDFGQAIPVVIAVIGFTSWIGLALLVRGEVLKQSALPYIRSCVVSGIPVRRILWRHLLPNIMPPVLVNCTFAVAGAILSESSLSFLGFGVQPPTASWGNLLRQAFENPLDNWHLTFFPGLALFVTVVSFHFMGEGLRRRLMPGER